ncbi:MAG: glycosyltransferase family 2 protein [Gammaproteobacteria bacterium]|nr:glycosyltransferase family 2 protein [Gammaproteobacteria bacterium]
MSSTSISILLPAYNAEQYIGDTIASIKAQTFDDYEVILVNDGSTDNTVDVACQAIAADQRFKILDKAHSNLIDTLNRGLSQCSGHWIARIDADDLMHPQRLELQYHAIKDNPQTVLLATEFANFSASSATEARDLLNTKLSLKDSSTTLVTEANLLAGDTVGHPTVMFNAAAAKQVGGYDKRYVHAEDFEYWLRLSSQGEVRLVNAQLTLRRMHTDNISRKNAGVQLFSSSVAREVYLRQQRGETLPLLSEDLSAAARLLKLKNKVLARYWGEQLSNMFKHQSYQKATKLWLQAICVRPYPALLALRYCIRHYRTGSVLKRWIKPESENF